MSVLDKIHAKLSEIAQVPKTNNPHVLFDYLNRMGMLNEKNMSDMLLIIVEELDGRSTQPNQ